MPTSLAGKTIVVTGAALGLGRAMTLALVQAGACVGALDLSASDAAMEDLVQAAQAFDAAGRIIPVVADVTREDEVTQAVELVEARGGAIWGLVNNAGRGMQDIGPVQVEPKMRFYEVAPEMWRGVIDVNLTGAFVAARCVAPRLVKAGAGRIVNVTTSFRTMQTKGFSPYGPSKAALEAATVIWSKDLATTGVTVNALLPGGAADTRMIPAAEVTDRGSLVQPDVMGAPIVWLMSDESSGVTGSRIIARDWTAAVPGAHATAGFPG